MEFVGKLFGVIVVDGAALHVPAVFAPIFNEESFNVPAGFGKVAKQIPLICAVAPPQDFQGSHCFAKVRHAFWVDHVLDSDKHRSMIRVRVLDDIGLRRRAC